MDLKRIDRNITDITVSNLQNGVWKDFAVKTITALRVMVDADKKYIDRLEKMNDALLVKLGAPKSSDQELA